MILLPIVAAKHIQLSIVQSGAVVFLGGRVNVVLKAFRRPHEAPLLRLVEKRIGFRVNGVLAEARIKAAVNLRNLRNPGLRLLGLRVGLAVVVSRGSRVLRVSNGHL